nr:hypothetical protein GCM10020185_34430 [Pseudomonas brassicacearum subsp. brassicacearum]
MAADDLLRHQGAALEAVLNASGNETLTLAAYALKAEDALGLPMLSLAGPLAVRRETLVENNRADFFIQPQHVRKKIELPQPGDAGIGSRLHTGG